MAARFGAEAPAAGCGVNLGNFQAPPSRSIHPPLTLDQLSDEARAQITNLRATDLEITRLKQQLAITQTAWMAYAAALKQALPQT